MADYQRIVEDIRNFLQGADRSLTQEVRDLAVGYVEVVQSANERLRRCKEYLNQCLRSEAIHVSESAPDLLDMVAVLDFPELPEWEAYCVENDLPAPPNLLLLVAEDLNTAYAVVEPLKEHLVSLRRMALTRAPLDKRLRVMRELAALDMDANYWHDDIASFEVARHREIDRDVKAAAAAGNRESLRTLLAEIETSGWIQPPSPSLVKNVKRHLQRITRQSGRDLLEFLHPQIIRAMQDGDTVRVEQLRAEWKQAAREAKLSPDDDLQISARAAFDWLKTVKREAADDEKFEAALGQLTRELARGLAASPETLAKYRQMAMAFGRGIPHEIEDHYTATVQGIEEAANKERRVFITKIAILVLLVVGFLCTTVVIAVYKMREKKDVAVNANSTLPLGNETAVRHLTFAEFQIESESDRFVFWHGTQPVGIAESLFRPDS